MTVTACWLLPHCLPCFMITFYSQFNWFIRITAYCKAFLHGFWESKPLRNVIFLGLRSSKLCAASFYWCPHNQHSPVRNLQHSSCIGLSGRAGSAGYKRSDLSVVSCSFVCYWHLTCCTNLDSDRHQPYRQLVVNKVGLCASLFLLLLLHWVFLLLHMADL